MGAREDKDEVTKNGLTQASTGAREDEAEVTQKGLAQASTGPHLSLYFARAVPTRIGCCAPGCAPPSL